MSFTQPTEPEVINESWGRANTTSSDMIEPDDSSKASGWLLSATPPPRQRFNWVFNWMTNVGRFLLRRGLPSWNSTTPYLVGDVQRGPDGIIYTAKTNNTNKTPASNPNDWRQGIGSPNAKILYFDGSSTSVDTTGWPNGTYAVNIGGSGDDGGYWTDFLIADTTDIVPVPVSTAMYNFGNAGGVGHVTSCHISHSADARTLQAVSLNINVAGGSAVATALLIKKAWLVHG